MKRILLLIFSVMSIIHVEAQRPQWMIDSLSAAKAELAQHPDSVDLMLKKAAWNLQLGDWDYAKIEYDKVLYRQPGNPAALYYRAFVNTKLGRYNFARLDYTNLLTIVPGNFEAQLGLALLNDMDHHTTEAMDQINVLIEQFPDSALAYAARAGMEEGRDQLLLAEYDYTQAIIRDPNNTDYILSRINVYIEEKKYSLAKRDLDILVQKGIPRSRLADLYQKCK